MLILYLLPLPTCRWYP